MENNNLTPEQKQAAVQQVAKTKQSNPVYSILFLLGLVIIATCLMVYNLSTLPNTPDRIVAPQKSDLDMCLDLAGQTYSTAWDKECRVEGGTGGLSCKINVAQATLLDNRYTSDKNDCYHQYPQ